jgi:hypothetical protein
VRGFICFGTAAVIMTAAASAQAGLFGFSTHRSGCCETDCCVQECCPQECVPTARPKRCGLLGRLFGGLCRKKVDCCETDCCDVGCAPGGYATPGVYGGFGVRQPAVSGQPAPAPHATGVPVPPQTGAPARPAPSTAPAPPSAPQPMREAAPAPPEYDGGEAYFPSRLRNNPAGASRRSDNPFRF